MFDDPAGLALVRLLTLAGRVPFEDAVAGLRPWEASVLGEALTAEELRLRQPAEPMPLHSEAVVVVVQSPMGRLWLHPLSEEPGPDAERLAWLELAPEAAERVGESAAEANLLESVARQPFDALLAGLAAEGRLGQAVRDVADRVDHVETVYVYVGRHLFARSDVGNTLLRGGHLVSLAELPLDEWTPDQRMFVAAFHLLFMTGRSIRMEEFNGRQLSARSTRAWLDRKHQLYAARLGVAYVPAQSLTQLAERIGEMRRRLEPTGAVGYRRVNGLTLGKRERVGLLCELDPVPRELSPVLTAFARAQGVSVDGTPAEVIGRLANVALREKAAVPGSALVERLLERIVLSAVCEGGADYGMSSSIRDPARLRPEPGSRCSGALSMVKQDFFCVSVPHPELVGRLDDETMSEVLQAVASRMRFNRWHFIAGNFEREEIPAKRHYFFPPLMPDMAQWSDLRHPGHTNSSVRHTIRTPGPALWNPPLRMFGNDYRGFFDIRLVRMTGEPFTFRELRVACHHNALMDAFWREAARMADDGTVPAPAVTGFVEEYWTSKAWSQAVAEATPSNGGATPTGAPMAGSRAQPAGVAS